MTPMREQPSLGGQLPDLRGHLTYVLEPLKILYVSVPKNACTSLTWLVAELAGEDLDGFRPGLSARLNGEDAIHLRANFRRTPSLARTSPKLRRSISPANGWFVFAVVRDPRSRLFSAWQNKFLMRTPDFTRWRHEDWYPRIPESPADVARDFARFVDLLCTEPGHPLASNAHFCDQTRLVREDAVPYSRVYDVAELPTLLADLAAHLRRQGVERELTLRSANETPLRANARVLAEPVRSAIEQLYAADFDNFGRLWDYSKIEKARDWTPDALQELTQRILLHERIDGLLRVARRQQRQLERAEQQLAQADTKGV